MTRQQKLLMRMASAIHERLHSKTTHDKCVGLPTAAWEQCESLNRKLQKATQRSWNLAANRLIQDLRLAVERLCKEIAELDHKLRPSVREGRKASVADIYADLIALHDVVIPDQLGVIGRGIGHQGGDHDDERDQPGPKCARHAGFLVAEDWMGVARRDRAAPIISFPGTKPHREGG